jgi:hypothetical protein
MTPVASEGSVARGSHVQVHPDHPPERLKGWIDRRIGFSAIRTVLLTTLPYAHKHGLQGIRVPARLGNNHNGAPRNWTRKNTTSRHRDEMN